jgi:energy-coupling factor transporter ATP-binding protein EcfA2
MSESEAVPESFSKSNWAKNLSSACLDALQKKKRAILCLTGQPGAGKSTLGKQIRKQGLPGIPRSRIAVIDDGVLSAPLLGIFNRRVKSHGNSLDELAPFEPYLTGKQLVVYVSSFPEHRLSACDIVVTVRCGEEERRRRLLARNTDGEIRFQRSANQEDFPRIPAKHFFEFVSR